MKLRFVPVDINNKIHNRWNVFKEPSPNAFIGEIGKCSMKEHGGNRWYWWRETDGSDFSAHEFVYFKTKAELLKALKAYDQRKRTSVQHNQA